MDRDLWARHTLTITYPEGHTSRREVYRVYFGTKRVTWIDTDGVRGYVLLRHGFTVTARNITN